MAVLLSLDKAADALGGISIWTLRKHIARGNVRVTHLGRRVFLDEEEMSRIMQEGLPSLRNGERPVSQRHPGNQEGHGQVSPKSGLSEQESQEFVAAVIPGAA
jgi:hypothetical protein